MPSTGCTRPADDSPCARKKRTGLCLARACRMTNVGYTAEICFASHRTYSGHNRNNMQWKLVSTSSINEVNVIPVQFLH